MATNAKAIPSGGRLPGLLVPWISMLRGEVAAIIRERPSLALGLLTVLLGAGLATWQAKLFPRRRTMWQRLLRGRGQFKAALALLPLTLKLLSNPLVQDYLRRTMMREVSRKLGR